MNHTVEKVKLFFLILFKGPSNKSFSNSLRSISINRDKKTSLPIINKRHNKSLQILSSSENQKKISI